jgi:hypothetical protein
MSIFKSDVGGYMWANDAQRDRIFEMIGTHTVTFHRVRNARLEQRRQAVVLALLSAAIIWALLILSA